MRGRSKNSMRSLRCTPAISTMPSSRSGSRKLPLADSRRCAGTMAIPPTSSAASSRSVSGQTLLQFEKQWLLDRWACANRILCCRQANWSRIAEPLPGAVSARRQGWPPDRRDPQPQIAAALGIRRGGHGLDGAGYAASCKCLLMRRAGRPALSQARDGRVDTSGPYRAGDRHPARPVLFPGPDQRFWARLCRRTAPPPNTTCRSANIAGRAAARSLFVDPKDDMFVVFMCRPPSRAGAFTGAEDADL